ncbi:hypothetical protein MTO96_044394 [Rhipicephalus appendiculatus]
MAMKPVTAHEVHVLCSLRGRNGKRAFVHVKLCRVRIIGCPTAGILPSHCDYGPGGINTATVSPTPPAMGLQ